MKGIFEKYLNREITLKSYDHANEGIFTLFSVSDSYFGIMKDDLRKYVPYTSVYEITDEGTDLTVALTHLDSLARIPYELLALNNLSYQLANLERSMPEIMAGMEGIKKKMDDIQLTVRTVESAIHYIR